MTREQPMQLSVLVKITPPRRVTRRAARVLLRAVNEVRRFPGFRGWQTFRALDASDTLFVLIDWASQADLDSALRNPRIQQLRADAAAADARVEAPETLHLTFDRKLVNGVSLSSLLRLARCADPAPQAESRDRELALRALAAPGSTRLAGARRPDGRTTVCRIDFDTEDGVWHFLDSRLRQQWTRISETQGETEFWALNLPHFECHAPDLATHVPPHPTASRDALSVQLRVSDDQRSVHVRLEGRIDARSSVLSEKFFTALINDGCIRLEVDVSGLTSLTPEVADILTRAARQLKMLGGQFVLVDNEARVKRITRTKHLETSVR